jgi:hypothetical protein
MARCATEVTEEKLKMLIENWPEKTMDELSDLLEVSDETINDWVSTLKQTMRAQGLTEELIGEVFPPMKAPAKIDCFESVVKQLFASPKAGASIRP